MKRAFSLLAMVLVGFAGLCLAAGHVEAQVGVGIAPGIIRVDKPLLPGSRYNLPSLQVINTGSEASQYEVELASVAGQKELQPPAEFIILSPTSFYLEPGASQVISLSLDIPVKAKPGDYLAYIEAHPVAKSEGGMTIGVAAANKLYFTVRPANVFVGTANRIVNLFTGAAPGSYIGLGAVVAGLLAFFLRRRIKVDIRITRR